MRSLRSAQVLLKRKRFPFELNIKMEKDCPCQTCKEESRESLRKESSGFSQSPGQSLPPISPPIVTGSKANWNPEMEGSFTGRSWLRSGTSRASPESELPSDPFMQSFQGQMQPMTTFGKKLLRCKVVSIYDDGSTSTYYL